MAICTNCGVLMHYDDMAQHKCKTEDLPTKGIEKKPTTTNRAL